MKGWVGGFLIGSTDFPSLLQSPPFHKQHVTATLYTPWPMTHDSWSMFHSPRCVTGGSPICNIPAMYSEDVSWLSWFRIFWDRRNMFLSRNIKVDLMTLWHYLRSYFVLGKWTHGLRRIGRSFWSVQFQPREELIITETVLVSIVLFDLNRVKLPAYKKNIYRCAARAMKHRSCIMHHASWITGTTLIQIGVR